LDEPAARQPVDVPDEDPNEPGDPLRPVLRPETGQRVRVGPDPHHELELVDRRGRLLGPVALGDRREDLRDRAPLVLGDVLRCRRTWISTLCHTSAPSDEAPGRRFLGPDRGPLCTCDPSGPLPIAYGTPYTGASGPAQMRGMGVTDDLEEEVRRVLDALDQVEAMTDPVARARAVAQLLKDQPQRNKRLKQLRDETVRRLRDDEGMSLRDRKST